jgi:hypothetical protein
MKDRAEGAIQMPFYYKECIIYGKPLNLKWWKFKQFFKSIKL